MTLVFSACSVWQLITIILCLLRSYLRKKNIATFDGMRGESYAESEAYNSASVMPIHTKSELSSSSDSAYAYASVASVNQPLIYCSISVLIIASSFVSQLTILSKKNTTLLLIKNITCWYTQKNF